MSTSDSDLAAYAKQTETGAARHISDFFSGAVTAPTDLNLWGAPITAIAKPFGIDAAPLWSGLNDAKNGAIEGLSRQAVGMLGSDTLGMIDGILQSAQSAIAQLVMQVTGWQPENAKLGTSLLAAQTEAKGAQLQTQLADSLAKNLQQPGSEDFPSAARLAKAVADGINEATLSGEALKNQATAAIGNQFNALIGKAAPAADPRQVAFPVAASVHQHVFQTALASYGESHPGSAGTTEAQRYAEKVADRIAGITLEEARNGKIGGDAPPHGILATLTTRLTEIRDGKPGQALSVELNPEVTRPSAARASTGTDKSSPHIGG